MSSNFNVTGCFHFSLLFICLSFLSLCSSSFRSLSKIWQKHLNFGMPIKLNRATGKWKLHPSFSLIWLMLKILLSAAEFASGTCIIHWCSMDCQWQLTLQRYQLRGNSTSQCFYYRIRGSWRWHHSQHKSISECHLLSQFICR